MLTLIFVKFVQSLHTRLITLLCVIFFTHVSFLNFSTKWSCSWLIFTSVGRLSQWYIIARCITDRFQICIRRRPRAIERPRKVSSALLLCTTSCTRASLARVSRLAVSSGCDHLNANLYVLQRVSVVARSLTRSLVRTYQNCIWVRGSDGLG